MVPPRARRLILAATVRSLELLSVRVMSIRCPEVSSPLQPLSWFSRLFLECHAQRRLDLFRTMPQVGKYQVLLPRSCTAVGAGAAVGAGEATGGWRGYGPGYGWGYRYPYAGYYGYPYGYPYPYGYGYPYAYGYYGYPYGNGYPH